MYEIFLIPSLMDSTRNYIYYLINKETKQNAIIDPGDSKPIIEFLKKNNIQKVDFIINTHHHWDHVNGNVKLKEFTGAELVAAKSDAYRIPGEVDIALEYDQEFLDFKIIHTPGHTKNHIAFYSEKSKLLFCGDTMFSGGCGGLFEGTAEEMLVSFQKFAQLPNDTRVYCAHEYTESNLEFALKLEPNNENLHRRIKQVNFFTERNQPTLPSSILIEKETNPFLRFNDSILKKALNCKDNASDLEVFSTTMNRKAFFYARR